MKFTLKVTGPTSVIAAILAATKEGYVHEFTVDGDDDGGMTAIVDSFVSAYRSDAAGNSPQVPSAPQAASPATETASTPTPAPTAPSAPIPAAPTAPAPAPQTSTDSDEEGDDTDGLGTDSDGLPWDERIHSSSKKKGKDGTWNKRRGGPDGEERAAIENELRAGVTGGEQPQESPAVPQVPSAPPPPPVPTAPVAPPPVPTAPVAPPPVPTAPTIPQAPETGPAAQPAPAPAPTVDMDFPTFMSQIGPKLGEGEGQIGAAYLAEVCQSLGINTMTDLALKPEQIGPTVQRLAADGKW